MSRWRGQATGAVVLAAAGALAAPAGAVQSPGEGQRLPDLDRRTGALTPTALQRDAVKRLGALVQWTRFGTPADLYKPSGVLGSGYPTTDPVAAARQYLKANTALYRLGRAEVDRLEVLAEHRIGKGTAVLLRQRLGGLLSGTDGLITVAVRGGKVVHATSSNTGDTSAPPAATLSGIQAWLRAAKDARLPVTLSTVVSGVGRRHGWTTFRVPGVAATQMVRKVAVPTPAQGNRVAFAAVVVDPAAKGGLEQYETLVDGRSGDVLVRQDLVDNLASNPRWNVFPSTPPTDLVAPFPSDPGPADPAYFQYVSTDTRQTWCFVGQAQPDPDVAGAKPCGRVLFNETPDDGFPSGGFYRREWDRYAPPLAGSAPSNQTSGNNADTQETWLSNSSSTGTDGIHATSATRDYVYPWSDVWNTSHCNPAVLAPPGTGNDIQAAMANLFAQHNRMHDWSYHLGFTEATYNLQAHNFGVNPAGEGDPERSGAQTGAIVGGPPSYSARNNANQGTGADGTPAYTNMYLWQPRRASFYGPCVDGDYDMSVIGHEYGHAISNRMVGGPDAGLRTREGGALGESWSDQIAVEYLDEYGLRTPGQNPFVIGAYVTADKGSGIRNYAMNDNQDLQYGDVGYDSFGPQVHADGEIWSATGWDIRQALIAKYNGSFPATNAALQARCANGTLDAGACPGNRRWMQIVFSAFLLQQPSVNMVGARNAYLAADRMLFAGANQAVLWTAFAKRGFGEMAESFPSTDGDSETSEAPLQSDPRPSFESPLATNEATVKFVPTSADGGAAPKDAELFVGAYEARATPIMDTKATDPNAQFNPTNTARFVPGTYQFVARAPGFGHLRFTRTFAAGQSLTMTVPMPRNLASSANGATATGGGFNPDRLIDDTEETAWDSFDAFDEAGPEDPSNNPVVTVDLAGTAPETIRRVRVSAFGPRAQFVAVRQFQVLTCVASGAVTCSNGADYTLRFTSPADAFPAGRPRPTAPDLNIRSFDVPDVPATHVRFRVLETHCTGYAGYHGEQDLDPLNPTDCRSGSQDDIAVAAEFQVLKRNAAF